MALRVLPSYPGVFTFGATAGAPPSSIALVEKTYMVISSSLVTAPINTPVAIASLDDFTNQFGSSNAIVLNSIQAYLDQTRIGLSVIRIIPYPLATATVTAGAGTKEITINGKVISVTALAGDTTQDIIDDLRAAINDDEDINLFVEAELKYVAGVRDADEFYLRSLDGEEFTVVGSTNVSVSPVTTPAELTYWDYVRTMRLLISTQQDAPLGFLTCPEAFYQLDTKWERTQVANAMDAAAASLRWMALQDIADPLVVGTPFEAKQEISDRTSPGGHSAAYFPYAIDADDDDISPSVLVAAFAMQRYQTEGIQEPPAGRAFPFRFVSGLRYSVTATSTGGSEGDRTTLADSKINPLLFRRGVGFIPYDYQTLSTDPNFRFIHTRVIMNCLEQSVQNSVDNSNLLFKSISSRSQFFGRLRSVLELVAQQFYDNGALFGATPDVSYAVRCDELMQDPADLEKGIVVAEVYAIPAGAARQIVNTVYRVSIGNLGRALANAIAA